MAQAMTAYRADPFDYRAARQLSDELGLSDPVAITLVRRGYRSPEEARLFLAAEDSHSPQEFASMEGIVDLVMAAIEEGRRITVYGDFDVDGVCATAILYGALTELEADCDWLIPDRMGDGYGLSEANVRVLAERGTSLIVTVDCGVTAVAEVALAKQLDMDVIVTDHHSPAEELPDCPILHPVLDDYPFKELCGSAVAWKLACALREVTGSETEPSADLDLVALATVADVVPLVGENRALVKRGLEEARRAHRPGMAALLEASKCDPGGLDETDFGFRLAPRINAAGRLYRADAGVELFLTRDRERADEIAAELGRANAERRATERKVDGAAEAARRELPEELRQAPALVVAGPDWHPGVIGIVASRMVERHHRPTIVISLDGEGGGRGSGRSIPGFDLLGGLEACAEHLERFGGHRAAAGLELRAENLEAFREAFAAHAASILGPEDLVRTQRIDAMVGGAGLGIDLAEELEQLRPFGMGNPGVRLLVPSARVRDVTAMGEGKHARFSLHSGSHRAVGVAFGRSSLGVGEEDPVDASVKLEVNRWNGSVEPRVVLNEIYRREAPATAPTDAVAESERATIEAAWWERFEAELGRDLTDWPAAFAKEPGAAASVAGASGTGTDAGAGADAPAALNPPEPGVARTVVRSVCSAAAVLAEMQSSGEGGVLAVVADRDRRAPIAPAGVGLTDWLGLEAEPQLARAYEHVVIVDPVPFAGLAAAAALPAATGGFLHQAWGDAEYRFSLTVLEELTVQRPRLIAVYRDLRDLGEGSGEALYEALRGSGVHPRGPEAVARGFRVLRELGLVHGEPNRGAGTVGVVSSEGTELERSATYRALGLRYQEGLRFLEHHRQT